MRRRLIQQGKGGMTIYLPKRWIDEKGLKPGDEVEITERDNDLIIETDQAEKKDFYLAIDSENRKHFRNMMTHLYRMGYDIIHIKGTDRELIREIRVGLENLLLGFEMTRHDKTGCTLENVSEPTVDKYPVMIRRIFLMIKETINLVLEDFRDQDYDLMPEMTGLRNQVDKFFLFCRRIITKGKNSGDPQIEWELLVFLMHIEKALFYMYKYASENQIKADKKIIDTMVGLKDYFNIYYKAYFKKDLKSIYKLNKLKDRYQFGDCFENIANIKGPRAVIHSYMREIFRLIQAGGSPVLVEIIEAVDEKQDESMGSDKSI